MWLETSDETVSGVFLYDSSERVGSVYTKSREVFDYFYNLKPLRCLFAEMKTEHENEIYNIYNINLKDAAIVHRFSYEISMAENKHVEEIEKFMISAYPEINRHWVNVALENGDKCFTVRLNNEIAGLGWVSFVNGVGRLHDLYVKPQFRRMGIGEDILYARLLWLKSKRAHLAFSEISQNNLPSSRIALKANMTTSGQLFQYFKRYIDTGKMNKKVGKVI